MSEDDRDAIERMQETLHGLCDKWKYELKPMYDELLRFDKDPRKNSATFKCRNTPPTKLSWNQIEGDIESAKKLIQGMVDSRMHQMRSENEKEKELGRREFQRARALQKGVLESEAEIRKMYPVVIELYNKHFGNVK